MRDLIKVASQTLKTVHIGELVRIDKLIEDLNSSECYFLQEWYFSIELATIDLQIADLADRITKAPSGKTDPKLHREQINLCAGLTLIFQRIFKECNRETTQTRKIYERGYKITQCLPSVTNDPLDPVLHGLEINPGALVWNSALLLKGTPSQIRQIDQLITHSDLREEYEAFSITRLKEIGRPTVAQELEKLLKTQVEKG